MQPIPLHRTTIVRPFTQFLGEIGAPVNRVLQQVKLPTLAIDDPNCFVSTSAFWEFIKIMAFIEHIDDLGFLVGKRFGANAVDPNFRKFLTRSPTLHHALVKTIQAVSEKSSNSELYLIRATPGSMNFCHRTSFGIQHPVQHLMEWFALTGMVDIVRTFTGPKWQPKEISLMSYHSPTRQIREYFPNCRIRYGQIYGFISIDNTLLSLPPHEKPYTGNIKSAAGIISSPQRKPAINFADSLKQFLLAYLREGTPHIELAAEITHTSTRTLQRHLAQSGLSYLELLAQIRYEEATWLLKEIDFPIKEIAYRLGYDDASHFSRAFRRFAGISPKEYRNNYKQTDLNTN